MTEFLLRRQEQVKKRIKETIEEQKRQKLVAMGLQNPQPVIEQEMNKTSNEEQDSDDDIVMLD